MGSMTIALEDQLNHPKYGWPLTLLRYAVQFPRGQAHRSSLRLREKRGDGVEQVTFQLVDAVIQDGFVESATVCFYADLPYGSKREFEIEYAAEPLQGWQPAEPAAVRTETGFEIANAQWNAVFINSHDQPVTSFRDGGGGSECRIRLFELQKSASVIAEADEGGAAEARCEGVLLFSSSDSVDVQMRCLSEGPVFVEFEIACSWQDGRTYLLRLLLHGQLPMAELHEEMTGFDDNVAGNPQLQLSWSIGELERRYSPNRGEEAADAYLKPDGSWPAVLLPYRNWNSWWHEKTVAFGSASSRVGLFVLDAGGWDDGQYALWGAATKQAVRFHTEEIDGSEECLCTYPIAGRRRQTAIMLVAGDGSRNYGMKDFERRRIWYSLLHLNKVKDWVLNWEEQQNEYPRFFTQTPSFPASVERMERLAYEECPNMVDIENVNPVSARAFFRWVPLCDLSASGMTAEQFKRIKAASAFMAYVHEDENVMPIRHMLAGHPNFLADVAAVHGMMAALYPRHPHAKRWRNRFEQAMALQLKYHVRPAVDRLQTQGGRWTENLGCYTWAALKPMLQTAILLGDSGDNPILYPRIKELAQWMLHAVSAPVEGKRTYPPQGAHSRLEGIPYLLRFLAQMLMRYDPLLGEQLLHITQDEAAAFEAKPEDAAWRQMLQGRWSGNHGIKPALATASYTGYGIVHRAFVGTPDEMSVHLQQLDAGPNYRWGRASDGGNGVLYYYAGGKRYSSNGPEDVGDLNRGDGEACTSFAVIEHRDFRGIGLHELTEPVYDFAFGQYSRIVSDTKARPNYLSRSVTVSGSDYIVLYDEVADQQTKGRFSWFVQEQDAFPQILQLLPGAAGREVALRAPTDSSPNYSHPAAKVKGRYYDGCGDFLTVVSHLAEGALQAKRTCYGAAIDRGNRKDYVFRQAAAIRFQSDSLAFEGKSGLIRSCGETGRTELAIFAGQSIRYGDYSIVLKRDLDQPGWPLTGFAMTIIDGKRIVGEWQAFEMAEAELSSGEPLARLADYALYIDGVRTDSYTASKGTVTFQLSPGRHRWEWTSFLPEPEQVKQLNASAVSGGAYLQWQPVPSAEGYEVCVTSEDEASGQHLATTDSHLKVNGLKAGCKYIVKVRACNSDHAGSWSEEYPLYGSDGPPDIPDGLRIRRMDQGILLQWGQVGGASAYRLYRKEQGDEGQRLVYEGQLDSYTDYEVTQGAIYEYSVAAINGNGESKASPARSTEWGGLTDWDPRPEEGFRRDPRNHEYGFSGYNPLEQDTLAVLPPYESERKEG
ncbi:fibronectin type III domain-containing protein [Paenibacillus paridis]|uniref:fibronectin type III domain-containing protein n=1 Tax=Paenibacillus paridis TaxID=2583376 RepID=UPI001121922A|nr:fibronectin type III domain-containing protein [Paenibacillus paridis]